jgi:hypothetical protein
LECNSDRALVSALGKPRREIIHANSKGNVCNRLARSRDCVGLVDEDPGSPQPTYIGKLNTQERRDDVVLLHDKLSNNNLIVLCPRLEEWILKAAKEAEVTLKTHGLPDKADQLHETISMSVDNFRRLVEDIKTKSQRINTLAGFLNS